MSDRRCFAHAHGGDRAPETSNIVEQTVNVQARKNLAQVSRMLEQISGASEFGDDDVAYVPVNDYINKAVKQMTSWMLSGEL